MPLESQIPLPTDNIYKFYALFGLLLFIFSTGASIYETHATNELVFQTVVELEALKQIPNPSSVEQAKKAVLQKRYDLGVTDNKTIQIALVLVTVLSVFLAAYGFRNWHKKEQPVQDEIAQLQLEKLRLEVSQMKALTRPTAPPAEEDDSSSPS